jgi:hypothetical protein
MRFSVRSMGVSLTSGVETRPVTGHLPGTAMNFLLDLGMTVHDAALSLRTFSPLFSHVNLPPFTAQLYGTFGFNGAAHAGLSGETEGALWALKCASVLQVAVPLEPL